MSAYSGPEIVNDGLVLCVDAANAKSYPGTGTTWFDISGTGYNISLLNGASYTNQYISFDNVDDYIQTSSFACNKTFFSIEWWLYPNGVANYNQLIQFNAGWGDFVWHTGSNGQYWVGIDVATRIADVDPGSVVVNTWQQWVWTFNNGVGTIYKNGSFLRTKSGMNLPSSVNITSFGTRSNSDRMNGRLSNIKIYSNKVLSAAEVLQNFNATRGRYGI